MQFRKPAQIRALIRFSDHQKPLIPPRPQCAGGYNRDVQPEGGSCIQLGSQLFMRDIGRPRALAHFGTKFENAAFGDRIYLLSVARNRASFERDQFSLVALWALLMAFRVQTEQPILSALLYCVALLKPSIGIPFLLLPLVDRRWGILGLVAIIQTGLLALSAWMLHAMPWLLLSQWIAVASYFRQGMYTVQDFINAAHLDGSFLDRMLPLALLTGGLLVVGRLSKTTALAFVSFVAVFWMYHNGYDFVVLLAALPSLLESTGHREYRWRSRWGSLASRSSLQCLPLKALGLDFFG
jgi:hypothetical protein